MIAFIKGRLIEKTGDHVVVECNGLGYELRVSAHTLGQIEEESVALLTHYSVSVDVRSGASAHQLFGFNTKSERDLFRQLIGVSGVSSTLAMTILSTHSAQDLASSILRGDADVLRSVKGIGPKLAQRVVMELGEKVIVGEATTSGNTNSGNMATQEALAALCSLGFERSRAGKTLTTVLEQAGEDLPVEELIKRSLKAL